MKLVIGNMKMCLTLEEIKNYVSKINYNDSVVVCTTSLYIPYFTNCHVGVQNTFYKEKGAYTGEISPMQCASMGIEYTILGHSERRAYFNETNDIINLKIIEALNKCMEIIERRIFSNFKLANGIFFNFQTQSIIKNDESYVLNKKESLLINLFIQNQGRIITYEEIEYHIWNNECTTAALKSLIRDLRKKTFKNIIKNYSGIGYKLELKNIHQQLS